METTIAIIAILLGILGLVGSIIPALPGPPLSWLGVLCLYIWGGGTDAAGNPVSTRFLIIWLVITVVVTILDYVVPAYFTKLTGGSKAGSWGATIGIFAGLLFLPIGIIIGPFLGAFLGELLFAQKDGGSSLISATGAFIGFLFGTGMKLVVSGLLMYYIFVYSF